MIDDPQYQNRPQEHSPEQLHANNDMAKSYIEALVVLACAGSVAYLVRLFV